VEIIMRKRFWECKYSRLNGNRLNLKNYILTDLDRIYWFKKLKKRFSKGIIEIEKYKNSKDSYWLVNLFLNKKKSGFSFHRLKYESRNGYVPLGYVINHKDGNKLNNEISNLESLTHSDNTQHAVNTGLFIKARYDANAFGFNNFRKICQVKVYGKSIDYFLSAVEISEMLEKFYYDKCSKGDLCAIYRLDDAPKVIDVVMKEYVRIKKTLCIKKCC